MHATLNICVGKIENVDIAGLNRAYMDLPPLERIRKFIREYSGQRIMSTSSFGTSSIVLLKMLSDLESRIPIYFIETGNHFLETHFYRNYLTRKLNLNVKVITAFPEVHSFVRKNELWSVNPEYCCKIKKLKPLENLKQSYDFWITGLMSHQTEERRNTMLFQRNKSLIKFNPLFDMDRSEADTFMVASGLKPHPLTLCGYDSVSCIHCTVEGSNRDGRWKGMEKKECGLHTRG